MAKHSRLEVLLAMKEIGLIPVFYQSDFSIAKNIMSACADGGAKVIEFTNRGDRAVKLFSELAEYRDSQRPEIILGAGSICDSPTAAMYIAAGADFVVGPILDEDTAVLCNSRKIANIPGCGTVSEIHKAHKLGADIIKIFPAEQIGGSAFIEAVRGPCPWAELMPTGGVSPTKESLTEWFNAGIVCAGMGSKLITKELLAAKDYAEITKKVKKTIEFIKEIRGK